MKMLFFNEIRAHGGGNKYMVDLINAISSHDDEVIVMSNVKEIFQEDLDRLNCQIVQRKVFFFSKNDFNSLMRKLPRIVRRGVDLFLTILEPVFFFFNILLFMWTILSIRPSKIVSCNGGYPASPSCLAIVISAKLLGIFAFLTVLSMPVSRRPYLWFYDKFIDKLIGESVGIVIVNAKAISAALHNLRGFPARKIEVIYNGIEDRRPSTSESNKANQFVIGCVARMDTSKGVLLLLEAFAHLSKQYNHIKLVLVGQGDASLELERRTLELNLQSRVQLLGHYEGDIHQLLNTFDIYAFPSLWEGLPYSIIEALCSGRAIVATKVGGIPEIINHGVEALLIEPHSVVELIEALERLINDKDLRQRLEKNARKKFEQQLTLKQMHSRSREIFSAPT